MTETVLSTGYISLSVGSRFVAQIPIGFCGETIPDESIFQPDWNREAVNRYWRERQEGKP